MARVVPVTEMLARLGRMEGELLALSELGPYVPNGVRSELRQAAAQVHAISASIRRFQERKS